MTYHQSHARALALLAALCLTFSACSDSDGPNAPRAMPTEPAKTGLEVEWADGMEYMFDIAQSDPSYPYSASYPAWSGQTAPPSGAFECPPIWAGITQFYHTGSGKWYLPQMGVFSKVMDVFPGQRFPNLPHALYTIPGGSALSEDGRHRFSGRLVLACAGNYAIVNGTITYRGSLFSVGTQGTVSPATGGIGAIDQPQGWAWQNVAVQAGVGSGWQAALAAYLNEGTCIQGWDVWVNETAVCKGGERVA